MYNPETNYYNAKVFTHFNPYFYTDTQIQITTAEQIQFYHKKIDDTRILGDFLKDKKYSMGKRKSVLKSVIKHWAVEFKESINNHRIDLLEKNTKLKKKKIKTLDQAVVFIYGVICVFSMLLVEKFTFFKSNYLNQFMTTPIYHNLFIGLVYLSLIACLYTITMMTYFDTARNVGNDSKKFIESEFRWIRKIFSQQQRELKSHLFKYANIKGYKQEYKLKKIYDPQNVIIKLEKYRRFIEDKIYVFSKYYYLMLFLSFIFKISVLSLTVYLIFAYIN